MPQENFENKIFVECRNWHSAKEPLCRVPGLQHSAKNIQNFFSSFGLKEPLNFFAECPHLGTRQRAAPLNPSGSADPLPLSLSQSRAPASPRRRGPPAPPDLRRGRPAPGSTLPGRWCAAPPRRRPTSAAAVPAPAPLRRRTRTRRWCTAPAAPRP